MKPYESPAASAVPLTQRASTLLASLAVIFQQAFEFLVELPLMRYQIKQRLRSLTPTFDIADGEGKPVLRATRTVFSLRSDYRITSLDGRHEFVRVRQRLALWMPPYDITRDGRRLATVKRRFTLSPKFAIEAEGGRSLSLSGDFFSHNYALRHGEKGELAATVSKPMWTLRDCYGIEVLDPEYEALALAIAIVIDDANRRQHSGG